MSAAEVATGSRAAMEFVALDPKHLEQDGYVHRSWEGTLIYVRDMLVVLHFPRAPFDTDNPLHTGKSARRFLFPCVGGIQGDFTDFVSNPLFLHTKIAVEFVHRVFLELVMPKPPKWTRNEIAWHSRLAHKMRPASTTVPASSSTDFLHILKAYSCRNVGYTIYPSPNPSNGLAAHDVLLTLSYPTTIIQVFSMSGVSKDFVSAHDLLAFSSYEVIQGISERSGNLSNSSALTNDVTEQATSSGDQDAISVEEGMHLNPDSRDMDVNDEAPGQLDAPAGTADTSVDTESVGNDFSDLPIQPIANQSDAAEPPSRSRRIRRRTSNMVFSLEKTGRPLISTVSKAYTRSQKVCTFNSHFSVAPVKRMPIFQQVSGIRPTSWRVASSQPHLSLTVAEWNVHRVLAPARQRNFRVSANILAGLRGRCTNRMGKDVAAVECDLKSCAANTTIEDADRLTLLDEHPGHVSSKIPQRMRFLTSNFRVGAQARGQAAAGAEDTSALLHFRPSVLGSSRRSSWLLSSQWPPELKGVAMTEAADRSFVRASPSKQRSFSPLAMTAQPDSRQLDSVPKASVTYQRTPGPRRFRMQRVSRTAADGPCVPRSDITEGIVEYLIDFYQQEIKARIADIAGLEAALRQPDKQIQEVCRELAQLKSARATLGQQSAAIIQAADKYTMVEELAALSSEAMALLEKQEAVEAYLEKLQGAKYDRDAALAARLEGLKAELERLTQECERLTLLDEPPGHAVVELPRRMHVLTSYPRSDIMGGVVEDSVGLAKKEDRSSNVRVFACYGGRRIDRQARTFSMAQWFPTSFYTTDMVTMALANATSSIQEMTGVLLLPRMLQSGPAKSLVVGGWSLGSHVAYHSASLLDMCSEGVGAVFALDDRSKYPLPRAQMLSLLSRAYRSADNRRTRTFVLQTEFVRRFRCNQHVLEFVALRGVAPRGFTDVVGREPDMQDDDVVRARRRLYAEGEVHFFPETDHDLIGESHGWDIARRIRHTFDHR